MEFLMVKWSAASVISQGEFTPISHETLTNCLVLTTIRTQLSTVEEDNAINLEAAAVFKTDKDQYYKTAQNWTNLYAKPPS